MFVLSKDIQAIEYNDHMGEVCKLGRYEVTVCKDTLSTQSGSYERGFKFHTRVVGYLVRNKDKAGELMSYDHGKTWAWGRNAARKAAGRTKVTLEFSTSKEFAFDAIQRINKEYDRNYKW